MNELTDERIQGLPLITRRLIELIGFEATVRLLRERGGRRTFFPATEERDSELDAIIGRDNVRRLARSEFAGTHRDLPMITKVLSRMRDDAIRAQRGTATKAELAETYSMSTRMVQYIWNTDEAITDDSTIDMFADSRSE